MLVENTFKNLKLETLSKSHLPNSASVFLANSTNNMIKPNMNVLEIGSGIGHVSLVLSKIFENSNFYGVEIQKELYEFSIKNKKINKINNVEFINDDIKNITNHFEYEFFDLIISNPPHYIAGRESKIIDRNLARNFTEDHINIFIESSKKMIKNKKNIVFLLHPNTFRSFLYMSIINKLEPFEIIPAYGKNSKEAQLVCLKLRKNGGKNLTFRTPYII